MLSQPYVALRNLRAETLAHLCGAGDLGQDPGPLEDSYETETTS